jgi:hypothetical protein
VAGGPGRSTPARARRPDGQNDRGPLPTGGQGVVRGCRRARRVPPPAGGVGIRAGQRRAVDVGLEPALTPPPARVVVAVCDRRLACDGLWSSSVVKGCSAYGRSVPPARHRCRCPALALDGRAGTCRAAVTAEPADPLLPVKAVRRRRERPWGGPLPGPLTIWRSPWRSTLELPCGG